jgi:hypothetical protein
MEIRTSPLWTTLAGVVAAAALFVGGYWTGIPTAAAPADAATAQVTFPDWFLPIWDAYDRNPAVTPDFDFAALYSGDLNAAPREPR